MNDIYSALITRLTGSTIAHINPATDIAYDNVDYDPSGKDAWLATNFIFVERSTQAKTATGLTDTGIFQIDVFVPLNDKTGGIKQYNMRASEIASDLLDAFTQNTELTFNTTKLFINETTFAAPLQSESWYHIPISINFTRI